MEFVLVSNMMLIGRVVFQKRVMVLLRCIEYFIVGNIEVWEDIYVKWEQVIKLIFNYLKVKMEDGQVVESFYKIIVKRWMFYVSGGGFIDLFDIDFLQEWINMIGFFCVFGGVCL